MVIAPAGEGARGAGSSVPQRADRLGRGDGLQALQRMGDFGTAQRVVPVPAGGDDGGQATNGESGQVFAGGARADPGGSGEFAGRLWSLQPLPAAGRRPNRSVSAGPGRWPGWRRRAARSGTQARRRGPWRRTGFVAGALVGNHRCWCGCHRMPGAGRSAGLVLFGPITARTSPDLPDTASIGGWYPLTVQAQYDRFVEDVPAGHPPVLTEQFDSWARHWLATDPTSTERTPPACARRAGRAPTFPRRGPATWPTTRRKSKPRH